MKRRIYSQQPVRCFGLRAVRRLRDEDSSQSEHVKKQPHTDYCIYSTTGRSLQRVRNASEREITQAAVVALAPGHYQIRARAEESGGNRVDLTLPVVIRPGQCTSVHLESDWTPSSRYID